MATTKQLVPPGPVGSFFGGNIAEFRNDRLGAFTRWDREFGDIVRVRLGPFRAYALNHPDFIESVLIHNARNFRKHYALRMNSLLLGQGLLTSDGDFWLRQRRLAQPAFQKSRIASYGPEMVAFTARLLGSWKADEQRDLHTEFTRLTLEITAQTLFGADIGRDAAEVGEALTHALESFEKRVSRWFNVPLWVPTRSNLRLRRAVKRLDRIVYGFIAERRNSGQQRNDLLSLLLNARDEGDGTGMTDKQLRDEMMTLFLAGHETTALALTWTCYLLSINPDCEAKLRDELRGVLGGRPPTVADLPKLRYTEWVCHESMRVYCPVYAVGREAISDCEIGGYPIKARSTLFLSQWVMHRHPKYWTEPERFHPERWANDFIHRVPRGLYFPFAVGLRMCIGNHFALQEMALVLATIYQKHRFEVVPGHPIVPWPSMTLRPKHGMLVTVRSI
jgi:cytochrome P450